MHRLLLAFALLLLCPAGASASTLNCKSGHTVLRQGGARIFSTVEKYERGDLHKLYLCSTTVRRPREFDDDYDVDESFDHWSASAATSASSAPGRTARTRAGTRNGSISPQASCA